MSRRTGRFAWCFGKRRRWEPGARATRLRGVARRRLETLKLPSSLAVCPDGVTVPGERRQRRMSNKATAEYAMAASLGLAAALWLFPLRTLLGWDATSFAFPEDIGQHIVGQRYLLADAWRWPPLVAKGLGWPDGTNIAFSIGLANYIAAASGHVVVIGHSYGGDTAATVVASSGVKVDALITLDPVSYFTPSYANVASHANTWIDLNAAGGNPAEFSNDVAGLGGDWGQPVSKFTTYFANVNLTHGQIGGQEVITHLIGP